MIEIEHIVKEYQTKDRTVKGVDDVSLQIDKGEIYGIVGYSGAGKSSLIRCMNLLEIPTSGKVFVDGADLTKMKGNDLRKARLKMGMIFQHFHLITQKTVYQNIAFALRAAYTPDSEVEGRVKELLKMVGLSDKINVFPNQLSGGQKQRVGIARALANNPSVLLCDEATSALDPTTTSSILQLLKKINKELNITIIIITHEMNVVKEICDRMAIMQDGKVVEEGSVYDIFSSPQTDLAKEFIQSVISFDIPQTIIDQCTGKIIKITFKGAVAGESVISDMIKKFAISGNFLHGSIEYIKDKPLGIFLMEITGDENEVDKALAYIASRVSDIEEVFVHD